MGEAVGMKAEPPAGPTPYFKTATHCSLGAACQAGLAGQGSCAHRVVPSDGVGPHSSTKGRGQVSPVPSPSGNALVCGLGS